jgi:hypothetical protein
LPLRLRVLYSEYCSKGFMERVMKGAWAREPETWLAPVAAADAATAAADDDVEDPDLAFEAPAGAEELIIATTPV